MDADAAPVDRGAHASVILGVFMYLLFMHLFFYKARADSQMRLLLTKVSPAGAVLSVFLHLCTDLLIFLFVYSCAVCEGSDGGVLICDSQK